MIDFTEGSQMRTNASGSPKTEKPNIIPKGQKPMLDEQGHLECEMEELRLEIKDNAERIDKLCNLLKQNNTKLRTLKGMNETQRNWKVETMNANYPILEVVDENTLKINGVEYKKVEKQKPQTLFDALLDDFDWEERETICRIVRSWLPPEVIEDGEEYHNGWNDCLKYLRERIK
jgi:hypothetical protein